MKTFTLDVENNYLIDSSGEVCGELFNLQYALEMLKNYRYESHIAYKDEELIDTLTDWFFGWCDPDFEELEPEDQEVLYDFIEQKVIENLPILKENIIFQYW